MKSISRDESAFSITEESAFSITKESVYSASLSSEKIAIEEKKIVFFE